MDDNEETDESTQRWGVCPLESLSVTLQSIDTVRTLHHTVIALRSALEEAKLEIRRLRSQLAVQTEIKKRAKYKEKVTQTVPTKTAAEQTDAEFTSSSLSCVSSIKIEQTHTEASASKLSKGEHISSGDPLKVERSHTEERQVSILERTDIMESVETYQHLEIDETPTTHGTSKNEVIDIVQDTDNGSRSSKPPDVRITQRKMASKIDINIKVQSNVKVQGTSTPGSQANETGNAGGENSNKVERVESTDNKFSDEAEEDQVKEDNEHSTSGSNNSVFFEEKSIGVEPAQNNKANIRSNDSKEEVDDIELIFSSDENRDPIQEDMVSISEYDPWQPPGPTGTPILVNFSALPPDRELKHLAKKITASASHDPVYSSTTDQEKSLESSDSFEGPRSTKSSSLEHETSSDQKDEPRSMGRDESMDFFDHKDSSFGRRWTNYNVIVETDISKCGIIEETTFEMYRRNTCPNPPAYRPLQQRDVPNGSRHVPVIVSKHNQRTNQGTPTTYSQAESDGRKKSCAAQTDITAVPDRWKSESQLSDNHFQVGGLFTLPSKFTPIISNTECHRHTIRNSNRTQEARRVLLSDINFTSMVPELSRSADHLCPEKGAQNPNKPSKGYYKGSHLKTPDYALKGITPSASMTSPGVSQWTVNENSLTTQTTQTGESWGKRGDSFDSCRSYSVESRFSGLDRSHRSRSVPSFRCTVCRLAHGIRNSVSMHYTPRVTFQEPASKVRGSLPDLRHQCACSKRYPGRSIFTIHGDSSGSTESLMDEADNFVRKSAESSCPSEDATTKKPKLRRMSETDIQKDFIPPKQSLPFLPKTAKCLKPGHLAKVIAKNGRVVVGRVRYVGPLATTDPSGNTVIEDLFVGVQLQNKCGDCDGSFDGRKFFECEPLEGLFVPFKKVVMAWAG